MFFFEVKREKGKTLTFNEFTKKHAKNLKREYMKQFNLGMIEGFSIEHNGLIIFACFKKD